MEKFRFQKKYSYVYLSSGRLFPFENWQVTCKVFKAPLFNQKTENCSDFKFEM